MKIIINNIAFTKYSSENNYKVDSEKNYISWQDGNKKEHRVYTDEKISGEFTLSLGPVFGMPVAKFLVALDEATDDDTGATTMSVWVNNLAQLKTIECFYEISTSKHVLANNGTYVDVLTVKIQEA